MLFRWIKEIKEIGINDWCWWVFRLKRDEFNSKLNISQYYDKYGVKYLKILTKDRDRAHNIDNILKDMK
jgi:hypothetical protein